MRSDRLTRVTALGRVAVRIRKGARVVWEAVRGLFASRMWVEPRTWTENEDDFWLEQ